MEEKRAVLGRRNFRKRVMVSEGFRKGAVKGEEEPERLFLRKSSGK